MKHTVFIEPAFLELFPVGLDSKRESFGKIGRGLMPF